ncbi:unnamed protein product [Rhizophagus irregularis]|nr:unnamed protein product [Rhizophagus irregularis]
MSEFADPNDKFLSCRSNKILFFFDADSSALTSLSPIGYHALIFVPRKRKRKCVVSIIFMGFAFLLYNPDEISITIKHRIFRR